MDSKQKNKPKDAEDDDNFRSSSWKMPATASQSSIPVIAVNEEVLPGQDEPPPPTPTSSQTSLLGREGFQSQDSASRGSGSSTQIDGLKQRFIRNSKPRSSKEETHNTTGRPNLKMWRRKLVILIWLNFLMKYRKKFLTFVEFLFPVICFAVICLSLILNNTWMVQFSTEGEPITEANPLHPHYAMSRRRVLKYVCSNNGFCDDNPDAEPGKQFLVRSHFIVYAPNNSFVDALMSKVGDALRVNPNYEKSKFFGVETSDQLEENLIAQWEKQEYDETKYPYGIQFSFSGISKDLRERIENNTALPNKLRYKIRTFYPETSNTDESFPFVEHTRKAKSRHEVSPYISTGFAGIQLAIDTTFVRMVKDDLIKRDIPIPEYENFDELYGTDARSPYVRMYEYPVFLDKKMILRCWVSIVLTIIISYAATNFAVAQDIAEETRAGKMELLKLHGLTPVLHWISYGINTCVMAVLISLLMAITIYYSFAENSILQDEYEHLLVIWSFFFLHGVAQYVENLLSVQFFSSPAPAGMFAVFKSLAAFLLPMLLFNFGVLTRWPNFILCLLIPQWCLANGIYVFLQYELYENGLDWYDFPVLIDTDKYIMASIPFCCILFVYNIALFLLLTIYFDRVFSKPYAPSITWKYLWKLKRQPKPEYQKPPPPINYKEMPQMYERPPINLKCTIKVRNLCKTFATEMSYEISLDNISVDIFEGEILAIVGPAGSGKTNLLHLIAGLINPTSGFVEMKNLKVHEYSDILNHYISICPQKCMLFPTLSVEDHVRLCCMVHGNSYRKSKLQAKLLLQLFSLQGARRHGYLYLSKTDVKKLGMAMALASSPTILILDEPCQGMDIESSKQLWKYLLSLKHKRTVIVATSRLEDVELFCDRMLLLVNGKAVCYGTANRIKRYYDAGSIINIQEGGEAIPQNKLQEIVNSEVTEATRLAPVGFEKGEKVQRYVLPFAEPYAALLEKIEDNYSDLKYKKIWISRLELGALLFKISNSKMIESALTGKTDFIEDVESVNSLNKKPKINNIPDMLTPEKSSMKQFRALLNKKWLAMTQRNRFWISEHIVPIMMMIMMISVAEVFLNHNPEGLARTLRLPYFYNDTLTLIKSSEPHQEEWIAALTKNMLGTPYLILDNGTNMLSELKRRNGHTLTNERAQAIIAVEKDGDAITGYYSSNSYHACPIVINVMTNSILSILTSLDPRQDYSVVVTNHPMPQYEGFPAGSTQNNTIVIFAYILSIILALISASEMRLPLWERRNGIKTLEIMAGVRPSIYWITNYCGGLTANLIIGVILMGIVCVINLFHENQQFTGQSEKLVLALIIFGYLCWSSVPYAYFLSSVLTTSHDAITHFLVIHFSIGIMPLAITFQILRTKITDFHRFLRYFLHLFPPYSLTSALVHYLNIIMNRSYCSQPTNQNEMCTGYETAKRLDDSAKLSELHAKLYSDPKLRFCCQVFCEDEGICHKTKDFFSHTPIPGLLADFVAMGAQGVFYWMILLLTENRVPQQFFLYLKSTFVGDKEIKATVEDTRDTEEPEDVKKEHLRVDYMIDIEDNVESEVILVQEITKFYHTTKCVDHVCFSIPVACTTGLLGVAKSGMSTLIKLLTGELRLSAGNIYMDNEHLTSKNRRHCVMKMGYCPQNNAYYPDLTGFQMLRLFAQLRGVPESQLDVQVRRWLTILDLETVAKMSCKGYRPGVLRRLCCAMAMIGWTRVVILDEPTQDMDLRETEIFWKAVHEVKKKCGQTTLFTSTLAEEVRYCTDKAMILDHGAILSVDRPGEVFKENPRGFMLSIKLRASAFRFQTTYEIGQKVDELRDHIIRHLSPCELLVDESTTLIYQLKDLTTKLSYAYGIMEGAREIFPNLLDNFLIAESSLDDLILNLHKKARMRLSISEDNNDEEPSG